MSERQPTTTAPTCQRCDSAARVDMKHGGVALGFACMYCADMLMRRLALEETLAGGDGVGGYMQFRERIGRPMTRDEAYAAVEGAS